jgi:hypothetical protein
VFEDYFKDVANSIHQQMAIQNSVIFEIRHVGDVLEEALSREGKNEDSVSSHLFSLLLLLPSSLLSHLSLLLASS